ALLLAGAGSSRIGVIAYTFSVFVLASIALEFARGTAARKALGGVGWAGAFSSLVARNRRHRRERLPDRPRGSTEAGPVDVGSRRPPRFPGLRDEGGVEPPRNPGPRRRVSRQRLPRALQARQEPVLRGGPGLE